MARTSVLALAVVAIASGCGHHSNASPVNAKEWHAVITDWSVNGRMTQAHSCAAVVVARTRVVPAYREGTPPVHALDLAERSSVMVGGAEERRQLPSACPTEPWPMIAGAPVPWLSGPHCWTYRTSARTVCFNQRGYVDRVVSIVHG